MPDTQPVTDTTEAAFLKAGLLGIPPAAPAVTPVIETPVVEAAPAPTPEVTPVVTPQVLADVPSVTIPADAPINPYATVVDLAMGGQEPAPVWDEATLKPFEATFGTKDPAEITAKLEAASLLKTQYEQVAPVVEKINALPPASLKAFQLLMDGKIAEAQEHLRSTPDIVLGNKEAKNIPTEKLVDTYFPGKIKAEQWALLNDPEADQDVVDAIKTRVGLLKDAAVDLHEAKRAESANESVVKQAAEKQAYENYQSGVATALSTVKNSPLKGLVDQSLTESIQTGKFLSDFVQQDGVTPTKDAGTLYLWAKHGPRLMEAAETRGYNRGKTEATLEAASRQPSAPSSAKRTPGDTPVDQDPANMWKSVLMANPGRA